MATVNIKPDRYAEKMVYLDGKPIEFAAMPYMRPILNTNAEKAMMMTARQVGKSTIVSTRKLVRVTAIPYWTSLYVAPRLDQVAEFSKAKLSAMIKFSPNIKNFFTDSSTQAQARSKEFLNGSSIVLRSCYLSPDGIRGITANEIDIDEVQDILLENIPVIEECSARKEHRSIFYTGTPKTFDSTIEQKWQTSTQHFWAIKCTHCNKWNIELGMENIGPFFLQCSKCKGELHALDGCYVAKEPTRKFVGYHISQLMVAGVPGTGVPWQRIIEKRDDPLYGIAKFYNECLGYSYDVGQKLITETDLKNCTDSTRPVLDVNRLAEWGIIRVCAGVDWGVLGGNTRTVLVIGGIQADGKLRVLYAKSYPVDQDPVDQVEDIVANISRAGCAIVAADRGNGHLANAFLKRKLPRAMVSEIEYKAKVNDGMKFNAKTMTWITDRTRAIAGMIIDIKRGDLVFPDYKVMEPFFPDLLTLSCVYNDNLRAFQILRKNDTPDDFAHALTYLRLASRVILPSPHALVHKLEDFIPSVGSILTNHEMLTDAELLEDTTSFWYK